MSAGLRRFCRRQGKHRDASTARHAQAPRLRAIPSPAPFGPQGSGVTRRTLGGNQAGTRDKVEKSFRSPEKCPREALLRVNSGFRGQRDAFHSSWILFHRSRRLSTQSGNRHAIVITQILFQGISPDSDLPGPLPPPGRRQRDASTSRHAYASRLRAIPCPAPSLCRKTRRVPARLCRPRAERHARPGRRPAL